MPFTTRHTVVGLMFYNIYMDMALIYIVKGFVLNDQMLKNGRPFGKDYFDELLEKIREIRASESRSLLVRQNL